MDSDELVKSINEISTFLAFPQITGIQDLEQIWSTKTAGNPETPSVDVVVTCASAVLHTADVVFTTLKSYLDSRTHHAHHLVLVLCGGRGHSTQLLWDAVRAHPQYCVLAEEIDGLPEARVLEKIGRRFFGIQVTENASTSDDDGAEGFRMSVLVEDESTNCGQNASKTKEVLDGFGVSSPRTIVVNQDPTMCRRTVASFQHAYADRGDKIPLFFSWPTFVPAVTRADDSKANFGLTFDGPSMGIMSREGLWDMSRFLDLILGEVPRLRNDEKGYGPNGTGFIVAVDIPESVEAAWKIVCNSTRGNDSQTARNKIGS